MQRFQTFFQSHFNICCANIYYHYTIQPCLQDYQLWVLLLLYFIGTSVLRSSIQRSSGRLLAMT